MAVTGIPRRLPLAASVRARCQIPATIPADRTLTLAGGTSIPTGQSCRVFARDHSVAQLTRR